MVAYLEDFGALGNGTSDDSTAIQNALNGGGTIFIKPGTYLISNKLTIQSRTKLQGSPGTIFKSAANLGDRLIVNGARDVGSGTDSDIIISDIVFDLNGANQSATNAPTFSRTNRFKLINCEFKNPYDALFLLTGSPSDFVNIDAVFEDCYFNGSGQAVYSDVVDIGNGENVKLNRCRFFGAQANSGNTVLSACLIDNFVLRDCWLDGNNDGSTLSLSGIRAGSVDNCEIKNSKEAGIRIQFWSEIPPNRLMDNFSITSNNIHDNAYQGIWLRRSAGLTDPINNIRISGNSIWNNQRQAIKSEVTSGLMVTNNSIFNNNRAGSYYAMDFTDCQSIRSLSNHIFDNQTTPTQTLLYKLISCWNFASVANFVSNISSSDRLNVTSSSSDYFDTDAHGDGVRTKAGTFTRDTSLVSGSVAYAGLGFKPSGIIFFATSPGLAPFSCGLDDSLKGSAIAYTGSAGDTWGSESIAYQPSINNNHVGHVASFDNDGFTIVWTKTGSPTGTIRVFYMAVR